LEGQAMTGKRYNIAISMDFTQDAFGGVFTNGLRQNNIFLYRMFQSSKNCENVWILNSGQHGWEGEDGLLGLKKDRIVRFDDIKDKLDYLLVCGTRPGPDQMQYLRDRGCKIVFYKGGNSAILSMEGVTGQGIDKYGEYYFDSECYDTVWMTPQHIHSYAPWARTIYRIPVEQVPQVWDGSFMELQNPKVRKNFGYKKKGSKDKWTIGVTDPNITVMKTIHMPVMVCEAAYRRAKNRFKKVLVTNSLQFMKNDHFTSFLRAMSVTRDGVLSVEQRLMLYDFLANHVDAIVTHQWENALNYVYYEVLYGNYPLIHNSPFLKDYGYYYETFDAESGGEALLTAIRTHDKNLAEYEKRNAPLFKQLNPLGQHNLDLHEGLLFKLDQEPANKVKPKSKARSVSKDKS
jgi:hypothetical protein